MASANEQLQDRAIRHALAVRQYSKGVSDQLVRLLNSADADIVERLAGRLANITERGLDTGPVTTKRLQGLLEEIRALNSAIYGKLYEALTDELDAFAAQEAAFQVKALESTLTVQIGASLPPPARLAAIVSETPIQGVLLKPWVEGIASARVRNVEQAIRLGLLEGQGTDAIVRRIRGTKAQGYRDGILDKSRRSTQAMVRTSVTHVSNVSAQETWRANAHVVKAWQYLATLDSRTTVTCAGLSGQTFPIGEGPIPPRHISCRSISVPVTKSFREMGLDLDELPKGKRASLDGQVAGDTTFKSWLLNKGEATQNEVLGQTRANLFRAGKLNLDDFIRSDGSILTLEELRKLYPSLL